MTTIMTASKQWASRPSDERYTSLLDMQAMMHGNRRIAKEYTVSSRRLQVIPSASDPVNSLVVAGANGAEYEPTHWAFGQLAGLSGAPAGYLRKLPAAIAADCMNWGMQKIRDVEDVGVLVSRGNTFELKAATGPKYGRVWNSDIVDSLVKRFGNGIGDTDFRVPGEFGKQVEVTKANTTLYASDRDMFVFLADEKNRIEIPDRRDGKAGSLARGFYVSNSEVGAGTLVVAMFLFDYVCMNRIIWGARDFRQISIRHSSGAPDRWIDEARPVIMKMAAASTAPIVDMVKQAKEARLDDAKEWLAKRYTTAFADTLMNRHLAEEARPIENLWDVSTALTAHARDVQWQDERVSLERDAGKILDLA